MIKNLIKKKWLELKLTDEVLKEQEMEKEQLRGKIKELQNDLEPKKLVNYGIVQLMTFKNDTCIASTVDETFIVNIPNEEEFKIAIRKLMVNDLIDLHASLQDKTCTFLVKLRAKLFSKFLPTNSFMMLENNDYVRINIDFKDNINISDIRNFTDIVVGKKPFVETDELLVQVLKSTLRDLSLPTGIELESKTLETVTLDTPEYTQITLKPKNEVGYKPLHISLSDFYTGAIRMKIKNYTDPISADLTRKRTIERTSKGVENFLINHNLIDDIEYFIAIIDNNLECTLYLKKENFSILQLKLGTATLPQNRTMLQVTLEKRLNVELTKYYQKELNNIYSKYNDKYNLPYTKRFYLDTKQFTYNSGIDALVMCGFNDLGKIKAWYELELYVLYFYGVNAVKNLTFTQGVGHDIEKGQIGDVENIAEIMSYLIKPYQLYYTARVMTKKPTDLTDIRYNWCGFEYLFKGDTLQINLTGKETQYIKFKDGYREDMYTIPK